MTTSQVTVARITDQGSAGPCEARNRALRLAPTPWVFLLDADTEPAPDCLDRLVKAARAHPEAAIVAPRVLLGADPERIQYDGGHCHFLAEMCFENAGQPVRSAGPSSPWPTVVSSTALLVRRERAIEAGLFDPRYVIFRDDLDFCLRIRARGFAILHCASAIVYHYHGAGPREGCGAGQDRGILHRRRFFFQTRNRWRTVLTIFQWRTLLLTLPLQVIYEFLNLLLAARKRCMGQCLAAWLDCISQLPEILRKRRQFQADRRVPDRELLGAPDLTWTQEVLATPMAGALRRRVNACCGIWWRRVSPWLA